jgi:hypothetical protein
MPSGPGKMIIFERMLLARGGGDAVGTWENDYFRTNASYEGRRRCRRGLGILLFSNKRFLRGAAEMPSGPGKMIIFERMLLARGGGDAVGAWENDYFRTNASCEGQRRCRRGLGK